MRHFGTERRHGAPAKPSRKPRPVTSPVRPRGPGVLPRRRRRPMNAGGRSEAERTLELLWHVLGGEPWVIGVTAVGLVGAVAGPWAIIKAASRPTKPRADD